jgi:hypothetical protein
MVHGANLRPVSAMLRRLDGSCTGHFKTDFHSLLTDESAWVGMWTEPDIPFQESTLLAYLLRCKPSDAVVVPCRGLLTDLESLLEVVKGEPGAGQVRLRVKGVATFARMILQVADRPNRHHGLVPLECHRERKVDPGARARDIDMRVNLIALWLLIDYLNKTFPISNVALEVLPSSAVFPRPVLRLRHEVEGKGGYAIQAFLIGTP